MEDVDIKSIRDEFSIDDRAVNLNCEMRFIGVIYKNPDSLVSFSYYVRSRYDFTGTVTKFLYDCADIMYKTRYQVFTEANVFSFMQEDPTRNSLYRKYGGWDTIQYCIDRASVQGFNEKKAFDEVKKYSLLREFERKGFDIDWIFKSCEKHNKPFEVLSPEDVSRFMRQRAEAIHTKILGDSEIEILNDKTSDLIDSCLDFPDHGFTIPFKILDDTFLGMQKQTTMAVAAMSNAGKSRFMIHLVAYAALVLKKRVLVLLNEMTVEKMRKALLTTVINNAEYQELYKDHITNKPIFKPEREIVMGEYRDDETGEFIKREVDDNGKHVDTTEEFIEKVRTRSTEYRTIKEITEWIDNETENYIFVKDISSNYSDATLEFEIRKAALTRGIEMFFYDTCKNESTGDWYMFKKTVSMLSELCKPLEIFGYLSIQLNDETNSVAPDMMNSSCIAEAKHIKHVLDSLIMMKKISLDDYDKYRYSDRDTDEWGDGKDGKKLIHDEKNNSLQYYCFVVDKNRSGSRPKLLFEVDLNKNVWKECGYIHRIQKLTK